jgi:hypothetical protein
LIRINSIYGSAAVDSRHDARPQLARTPMNNASSNSPVADDDVDDEPIPVMQQLLDNPFLLLFLGIAMPTVLYIVWGVMEIVGIPIAK